MTNEELTAKLSALRGDVASKSRSYASALKGLDDVLKALKDPTKNAVALSEALGKLRKDNTGVLPPEDLASALEQLDEIARKELDNAAFTFKRDLQAAFAEKNIGLESPSRDRFYAEPFQIDVDARGGAVNVMYGHDAMNAKPIPLDPTRVLAAYAAARKALVERKSNLPELLKRIFEAYRRLLAVQGKNLGERVGVIDLYRELVWLRQSDKFRSAPAKASFTEYPRAHFAYDVRQLQATNTLMRNGHRSSSLSAITARVSRTSFTACATWRGAASSSLVARN